MVGVVHICAQFSGTYFGSWALSKLLAEILQNLYKSIFKIVSTSYAVYFSHRSKKHYIMKDKGTSIAWFNFVNMLGVSQKTTSFPSSCFYSNQKAIWRHWTYGFRQAAGTPPNVSILTQQQVTPIIFTKIPDNLFTNEIKATKKCKWLKVYNVNKTKNVF